MAIKMLNTLKKWNLMVNTTISPHRQEGVRLIVKMTTRDATTTRVRTRFLLRSFITSSLHSERADHRTKRK